MLLRAKRFDGAWYLCGYAVELALKARICRTLKWADFPESSQDFNGLQSLKTHNLEILLRFSRVENKVKTRRMAEWSKAVGWRPDRLYQNRLATAQQSAEMVKCVERLLEVL